MTLLLVIAKFSSLPSGLTNLTSLSVNPCSGVTLIVTFGCSFSIAVLLNKLAIVSCRFGSSSRRNTLIFGWPTAFIFSVDVEESDCALSTTVMNVLAFFLAHAAKDESISSLPTQSSVNCSTETTLFLLGCDI